MNVFIVVNLQEGTGEPEGVFYTEQKARNYLSTLGYTERKSEPLSFYHNPEGNLLEAEMPEEYDMIIYEEEIQ